MISDEELLKLRKRTWKSAISKRVENFSAILDNDKTNKFNEEFIEKLTAKYNSIFKLNIKISIVYFILMIALFTSQNLGDKELLIFGYSFKNLNAHKEILLFLATLLSPFSSILMSYQKYLLELSKECIKKLFSDNKISDFYKLKYLDDYISFLFDYRSELSTIWRIVSTCLMLLFILIFFALIIVFYLGALFIQVSVIYDVIVNPSLPHYINLFVIVFAILSILFSWIITILQIPMPINDSSFYLVLSEIQTSEPERYKRILNELSIENKKKERISMVFSSLIIYIMVFFTILTLFFRSSLNEVSFLFWYGIIGAFIIIGLTIFTNKIIKQKAYKWFFKIYPNNSEKRTKEFHKIEKRLLFTRLMFSFLISIIYVCYIVNKL